MKKVPIKKLYKLQWLLLNEITDNVMMRFN